MRPVTFLVAVLAVTPLTRVTAQEPPPVKPGDRVRVTAPDLQINKYDGSLVSLTGDTIAVDTLRVAFRSVTRLDVYRGRRSHWIRGAGVGLVIGAGIGAIAIASQVDWSLSSSCDPFSNAQCVLIGAGLGAAVGIPVGALIGLGVRTDRWHEVPLDRLRVSFAPQRGGRFALGLSVRF